MFNVDQFSAALLTKRCVTLRVGVREAAEKIGISAATLSRLENRKLPDIETYYKCCQWLGKSMDCYFPEPAYF